MVFKTKQILQTIMYPARLDFAYVFRDFVLMENVFNFPRYVLGHYDISECVA